MIQVVALNFTANGGDGYVVKTNADNFRFILNDGTLSAPIDEALNFTDVAVVPANALDEQEAFAEYFQEYHSSPGMAFDDADTPQALDQRIQNQAARTDTVLAGLSGPNEAPEFTSPAIFSVAENQQAVGQIVVTDAEGDPIILSLSGGDDQAKFVLSQTGVLSLAAPLDFENPEDADRSNVYKVEITGRDSAGNAAVQAVSVTITDVAEGGVVIKGCNGDGVHYVVPATIRSMQATATTQ